MPKKVLSARRVPLRYKKEANKTIKELVERGVITPVNEMSDWCSPPFFIPKGDKIQVSLETDYTELNKHVNRPIHLFAHTTEILQAIHGHFQLGLDEESSRMTTFLLPQGKFRYVCRWD